MSIASPSDHRLDGALEELPSWPVERVVGQLLSLAVGKHSNGSLSFDDQVDDVASMVREMHIGGICYYPVGEDGNHPETVRSVATELNRAATLPLLFAADQEGGMITRVREPALRQPSAMALSAAGKPENIRELARISGEDLRRAGVNFCYAPVADVNTEPLNPVIGVRSAGSAPKTVASFDKQVVKGLQSAGVASCLKHFPGHGNTTVDSHIGLPVSHVSLEDWLRHDSLPFRAGIAAGADSVMMGHLVVPALDPSETPATFSHRIVTELLREELGFSGVIVTDALDMAGAAHGDGAAGACIAALLAGNDQLLMPQDPRSAYRGIIDAVANGTLDLEVLRNSARRILELKLHLARVPEPAAESSNLDRALVASAFAESLTWRDPLRRWKIEPARAVRVVSDIGVSDYPRGSIDVSGRLVEELLERGVEAELTSVEDLSAEDLTDASCSIVMIIHDAHRDTEARERTEQLAPRSAVVIASRSPYDAALIPEDIPLLMTFGDVPGVVSALADALISGYAPGMLPVDLVDTEGFIRWPRRASL